MDVSDALSIAARKTSVGPRTHHQHISLRRRVLFHKIKRPQRTLQVLGIEPAAYSHHRGLDVLQMFPDRSRLPLGVIRGVLQILNPVWILVLEILFVGILKR